jgi:magnesium transporter
MVDALPLARAFAARHAEDAADVLEAQEADAAAALLAAMDDGDGAAMLEHMAPAALAAALDRLPADEAVARLRGMTPQGAAGALRAMETGRREALLAALPRARRVQIGLILRQPLLTVGAWMDSRIAPVRHGATAGEALRRLSRQEGEVVSPVTVTDGERRLLGAIELPHLLAAAADRPVEELMTADPPRLFANAALDAALLHPGWAEHDALPVVDADGKLVGMIRFAVLRRAVAEMETGSAPDTGLGSFMDVANLCYLGMAGVMNATIARRPGDEAGEDLS